MPRATPPSDIRAREDWFFMWVGLCLTRWGYVNEELYHFCRMALRTSPQNAAIVFYKTPSFDARLTLTDELLRAALPNQDKQKHPLRKQWSEIHRTLKDLSPVRNVIAHQQPAQTGEPIEVLVPDCEEERDIPFVIVDDQNNWFEMILSQSEAMRGKTPKILKVRDHELPDHFAELKTVLARLVTLRKALFQELLVKPAQQEFRRS